MSLIRLTNPAEAQQWCAAERAAGRSIGLVPTMGALHRGHAALVRQATQENDIAVVSVFVNPLQFNESRDLKHYPRDWEGDCASVAEAGGAMIFTGRLGEFFPGGLDGEGGLAPEFMLDPGPGAEGLEGDFRPGHFAGVATIVQKLFQMTQPNRAYFGLKDFQQCLVVQHLARKADSPEIVLCGIFREDDGLALSSRNKRLTSKGRSEAPRIQQALQETQALWRGGERRVEKLQACLAGALEDVGLEVEYAAIRDPRAWTKSQPARTLEVAVALVAARAGDVRLIDNLLLDGGTGE